MTSPYLERPPRTLAQAEADLAAKRRRRRTFGPGDRVRHLDGREGTVVADPHTPNGFAAVAFDRAGGHAPFVLFGFLEKLEAAPPAPPAPV
jgi:hypothetical protein